MTSLIILQLMICGLITSGGSPPASKPDLTPNPNPQEVYENETDFALNLYRAIASTKKDKNIFISPVSVSFCLAMTSLGANKNTLSELLSVFKVNKKDNNKFHKAMKELRTYISRGEGYQLKIANKIFADESISLLNRFSNKSFSLYDSKPQTVNFRHQDSAKKKINNWVSSNTNNKITKLIDKIESETKIILANAVYFKGKWLNKFEKKSTSKGEFHVGYSEYVKVPMMTSKLMKVNTTIDSFKNIIIEMPYVGGDASMYIFLPRDQKSMENIEEHLVANILNNVKLREISTRIQLPKFKLKDKSDLVEVLQKLGVKDLFSEDRADLGKLTKSNNVKVSQVIHEAQIDVNEEGTEASAATAVVALARSYNVIQVTRPFLFFIRNKSTGTILFLGKVIDPRSKK